MPNQPRALDLFCGAGGVCVGLQRAGYTVTGVDLSPQPDYPGHFVQADALDFTAADLAGYDLVWASPPCQAYTTVAVMHYQKGHCPPDLLEPTRALLRQATGKTVIENVPDSPLRPDLILAGKMFGLPIPRRRIFELSFPCEPPFLRYPAVPYEPIYAYGGGKSGNRACYSIRLKRGLRSTTTIAEVERALGITHIVTGTIAQRRKALNNAIPPVYAEWIGRAARNAA